VSFDLERLYALLPAVYRARDAEQDKPPLKSLLAVIAEQVGVLEEDLAQLYDDQFIETCAEWVVPYIGDLVGTRALFAWPAASFSNRAQVAHTLAYRRRKGTAAVLEQLARDATGWDANVVEFFQLLATTQYMKHLRPQPLATVDLRDWRALERAHTPFDVQAHTVDVRRIESRRGKYNIPNVGLFLWRLGSHSLTNAPAYKVDDRHYLFNPLGFDTVIYNRPVTEAEIEHLATPLNVPMPLSRRVLDADKALYYGADNSLTLTVNGTAATADEVLVCDLSGSNWAGTDDKHHKIDPVLGRILLKDKLAAKPSVRVTFHYGFSAELGGGEYGRASSFTDGLTPLVKVPNDAATIQAALNALGSGGVVELESNDYFIETPDIHAGAGATIELRAADEQRPVVVPTGDVWIKGGTDAEVIINGLALSGGTLHIPAADALGHKNELRRLRLVHCTLLPLASQAIGGVAAEAAAAPRIVCDAPDVIIELERSIVGAIHAVAGATVRIVDSIVDASDETLFACAGDQDGALGAALEVENSTIIGRVYTQMLEASNTIFLARAGVGAPNPAPIKAERLQQGCVRFSYVPPGSLVPRTYRCQPEPGSSPAEQARVRPSFNSLHYGDASYCQLSANCAVEIRQGAADEAEMGAFHQLYQPQRTANLRARLDEYLRFNLEAGIFYAS
jgi:hypothetical protein